ncbi:hypothetical protein EDB80DRAFT_180862 [Ilyonectria destructans]|nr:hypothetical protein EDB80DRAFT_180862 [Ilyonectria destructans]
MLIELRFSYSIKYVVFALFLTTFVPRTHTGTLTSIIRYDYSTTLLSPSSPSFFFNFFFIYTPKQTLNRSTLSFPNSSSLPHSTSTPNPQTSLPKTSPLPPTSH